MNKRDLEYFENRLKEERARLIKEIDYLDETFVENIKEASGDLSSYSHHMADLGSDAYEREMNTLRSSTEGRLLLDTIEALRRLYRGEYGVCAECSVKITRERLMAMPQARLCLACKTKEERIAR